MYSIALVTCNDGLNSCVDAAVAYIDVDLAKQIMDRRNLFLEARRQDKDLVHLEFWHTGPYWIEAHKHGSNFIENYLYPHLRQLFERDDVLFVPNLFVDGPESELKSIRVHAEGNTMVIQDSGFFWRGYLRHTNEKLETEVIEFKDIEPLLDREAHVKGHPRYAGND